MCVARGNSKIRPSYLQARAASRANHLARRAGRLELEARQENRAAVERLAPKRAVLAESLAAKCSVSQSQSQEKHPCFSLRRHQHTHARTHAGVEECERCRRRARRTTTSLGATRRRRSPRCGSTHV